MPTDAPIIPPSIKHPAPNNTMSIPANSSYPPNHHGTGARPWLECLFIRNSLNIYALLTLLPSAPAPSLVRLQIPWNSNFANFGLYRPSRPSDINLPVRSASSASYPLNSQSSAVLHYPAKGILRSVVKMGSHPGAASPARKADRFLPGTYSAAPSAAPGCQTD